jgi:tetratricopeptide (TPR) repeat protein
MLSWIRISSVSLLSAVLVVFPLLVLPLQAQNSEQLEVGPPPLHRVDPPAPGASPEELERRGDQLRTEKNFLDAVDYYYAALKGAPGNASVLNKIGICQLMMQRYKEAGKSFERAIKADRKHADAYNNLGVVYYQARNYNAAIKRYEKAVALNDAAASYYSNMGAAYFGKKQFEKAIQNYSKALELDADIFERTSHAGVLAQLPSPGDRAHYDYVLAKLYAKNGVPERSLHYLKKAMEDGYKDIKNVYKDSEFATLRKDPRFTELMAAKTTAIPD